MGVDDEITIQESISQTANDVGGIGESFIPQAEPNQPPGCDDADLPALQLTVLRQPRKTALLKICLGPGQGILRGKEKQSVIDLPRRQMIRTTDH